MALTARYKCRRICLSSNQHLEFVVRTLPQLRGLMAETGIHVLMTPFIMRFTPPSRAECSRCTLMPGDISAITMRPLRVVECLDNRQDQSSCAGRSDMNDTACEHSLASMSTPHSTSAWPTKITTKITHTNAAWLRSLLLAFAMLSVALVIAGLACGEAGRLNGGNAPYREKWFERVVRSRKPQHWAQQRKSHQPQHNQCW